MKIHRASIRDDDSQDDEHKGYSYHLKKINENKIFKMFKMWQPSEGGWR